MTFNEAREKLREFAAGKNENYIALSYELTESHGEIYETKCSMYFNTGGLFIAPTWEKAYEKMVEHFTPKEPLTPDGAPEEEDV